MTAKTLLAMAAALALCGCSPTAKVHEYLGETRSDIEAADADVAAAQEDLVDVDTLLADGDPARPFVKRASGRLSEAREHLSNAKDRTSRAQRWAGGTKDRPFGLLAGAADFLWLVLVLVVIGLMLYLGGWGLIRAAVGKLTRNLTESDETREARVARLVKLEQGQMAPREVIAAERAADPNLDRKWNRAKTAEKGHAL